MKRDTVNIAIVQQFVFLSLLVMTAPFSIETLSIFWSSTILEHSKVLSSHIILVVYVGSVFYSRLYLYAEINKLYHHQ